MMRPMTTPTTLADIEKAADALPAEQKWELLGFLKSRLMCEDRSQRDGR